MYWIEHEKFFECRMERPATFTLLIFATRHLPVVSQEVTFWTFQQFLWLTGGESKDSVGKISRVKTINSVDFPEKSFMCSVNLKKVTVFWIFRCRIKWYKGRGYLQAREISMNLCIAMWWSKKIEETKRARIEGKFALLAGKIIDNFTVCDLLAHLAAKLGNCASEKLWKITIQLRKIEDQIEDPSTGDQQIATRRKWN